MNDFASELVKFESIFSADLAEDLRSLPNTEDIYAYAIEVPDDMGNLCIISAVACESAYRSQFSAIDDFEWWESVLIAFSDRYTAPDWNYRAGSFSKSNDHLSKMQESCFPLSDPRTFTEKRDQLYEAVLRQMKLCKTEKQLTSDRLNLIMLSDEKHYVTRKSFNQLNSIGLRARLWPLYNIHWLFYCPFAVFGNLAARLAGKKRGG